MKILMVMSALRCGRKPKGARAEGSHENWGFSVDGIAE